MERCRASSIHPNPLFFMLNLTQMQKNWLHIPLFFGGKIYQISKKKLKSFSPHLDLDFSLEATF
jgi:hypothetical protein